MSYDIYLTDVDGKDMVGLNLPNPTYNLTPIFDLAITGEPMPDPFVSEARVVLLGEKTERPRGLRVLSGKKAEDTIPALLGAVGRATSSEWQERLLALEPANGWGTLKDAVSVFHTLLGAALANPTATWRIQ